ncbi:MAG: penicillin acylase family protein [Pseudomonadales bacterium]|jgi:penicillin amidase|nr:penicillin acylase family protein [Pseudomonadales bacterium]
MHPKSSTSAGRRLLAALLCLAASAGSTAALGAEAVLRLELEGLEAPAEILVDRWGVPHIYARDSYDAFFVQGFNAARDRLWQIDLWRRRGLGRLAEVFGPDFVEQDRAARLFLYRGSMFREWLAYGSDAKRIAEAFTAGVNAFVALTERDASWLPPEFELLDYRPARWAAEDVVRIRSHGLWRNVVSEVLRARSACVADLDADRVRQPLEPAWTPALPEGFDPCSVPEGVLEVYLRAKAPVRFDGAGLPQLAALDPEAVWRRERGIGSNNWVVAPTRTDTGRPILADDPHRGHAVPSLRYIAHLSAPGLEVIGAGEPALPGISIGHNERIAFGLTIFPMDQEDLYFYETDAGDPGRYRYGDGFEGLREVRERIAVRGGEDETVTLRFTRHGPVVFEEPEADRIWAVRAAWLEEGMAPYFGSVEYMRAQNWDEFVAALNRWGAPSENQVYADVDGNIGYKPAGLLPRRPDHDGLLPVPGDGRYEWDDFHDMDELPESYNPARGWVATANALTLPPDFPIDDVRVGFEWTAPWRQDRIGEVLAAPSTHRFAASVALQRDHVSLPARAIASALAAVEPREEIDGRALALLRGFDGELAPDSAAAALFEVWFSRHLRPAVAAALLGADDGERIGPADTRVTVRAITRPGELLTTAARDNLVRSTLIAAWADVAGRLGWEEEEWRWGDLHRSYFVHPLAPFADSALGEAMTLLDRPMGGSGETPNNTRYGDDDFLVRGGASFRMVLDVGEWDAGRMTNAPGQSGVPGSPHYGDLLAPWAELDSLPLLFSREAVEAATVQRIELRPAP